MDYLTLREVTYLIRNLLALRRRKMSEKLDKKETVSVEELAISNMCVQEALVNLLTRKGLLTKEEILEEISLIKEKSLKGVYQPMIKRYMRNYLITILTLICASLLLSVLLSPTPSPAVIRTVEGTVTQVTDGDTLKVETPEGTKLTVRLYGIDAPEIERLNHRTGLISKQGQPYGKSSYEVLEAKVLRRKVKVDIVDIDRYKRMVGIVYLDGRNINLEMVKGGWA
jgi:micrococcal nuclease